MQLIDLISGNIQMYFGVISDPGLPKDLQVLSYKTKNVVDSIEPTTTHDYFNSNRPSDYKEEGVEFNKVPKRPYICACALFILYWGFCVVKSGG